MSRFARALLLAGLGGWLAGCASPPATDPGHFSGGTYENPSLGFRVVLPTGWVFLEPQLLEKATHEALSKQAQPSSATEQSLARSKILFGLVELTNAPEPGGVPRSLAATVESLQGVATGTTSETYAAATRMRIEAIPGIHSEFGQWRHQMLAGEDFIVLPTVAETAGKRAHQDYFIRVENDQALGLVVVYPEDGEAPQQALDAFQPLPHAGRAPGDSP